MEHSRAYSVPMQKMGQPKKNDGEASRRRDNTREYSATRARERNEMGKQISPQLALPENLKTNNIVKCASSDE